ncbi:MAG TPA: hypothetical protein VFY10_11880, partial [Dehalococcoidia bacterium]|nr:hypothetical protein [Dehalococcoidia bacterium]
MNISGRQIVGLLGFVGIIAGSFMPWAEVGIVHANGTDGDGVITLILGLIGAVAIIAASGSSLLACACILVGLASVGIALYDISNVSNATNQVDLLGSTLD